MDIRCFPAGFSGQEDGPSELLLFFLYPISIYATIIMISYPFSTFTDTGKIPFKIDFFDGIFACKLRFLYGQRSKCADLLSSYTKSINIEILW